MSSALILGASSKVDRFANIAQKKLLSYGHQVTLVNPKGGVIDGLPCYTSLEQVKSEVQVISIYIKPSLLELELSAIIALEPLLVIFNPGTESPHASELLSQNGIHTIEDCTLIMLDSGRFPDFQGSEKITG
jgi:predicted CoA-binding protein